MGQLKPNVTLTYITRNGVVYSKEEGSDAEQVVGWSYPLDEITKQELQTSATIVTVFHHPV